MKLRFAIFFLSLSASSFSQNIDTMLSRQKKANTELQKKADSGKESINDLLNEAKEVVKQDKPDTTVKKKTC